MKKYFHIFILIAVLSISLLPTFGTVVFAGQEIQYVPLEQLPGTTVNGGNQATFSSYVPGMFKLLIGVAAALAVIMIIIGGIQYIGAESLWGKQDGREKIQHAIWGLILAIFAWLLLNTINPNLTTLNLNIETVDVPESEGTAQADEPHSFNVHLSGYNIILGTESFENRDACVEARSDFMSSSPSAVMNEAPCQQRQTLVGNFPDCWVINNNTPDPGPWDRCFAYIANAQGYGQHCAEIRCYPGQNQCLAANPMNTFPKDMYAGGCYVTGQ